VVQTSLTLDVDKLLRVDEDSDVPTTSYDWSLLLHYIATSATLHEVWLSASSYRLTPDPIALKFSKHLLRAVRSNPNVRELGFSVGAVYDARHMVALLNHTTSLQELELNFAGYVLSDHSRLIVAQALARNTRVTHLNLRFGQGDDVEMIAPALRVIHQNTTLQKLGLIFDGGALVPGHVWSSLLLSGVPLGSLELSMACFDRVAMEHLLNGLIGRSTAIDLKFRGCGFDHGAIDALADILPTVDKRLVSRLTIDQIGFEDGSRRWNEVVAAVNSLSLFQHLVFGPFLYETCALLEQLTAEAPKQMESLTLLQKLSSAETKALVAYVKSAIYLKNLSVDLSEQNGNFFMALDNFCTALEGALKENGSLVYTCEGLTDKYCMRNANLGLLLGRKPMPLDDLSLIPSLFQAAKAAKKMAANMILTGLLSCGHLDNRHHG
jgi:hypothetical protein